MRPVPGNPTAMQMERTAAAPIVGIKLFHETIKISGTMTLMIEARRWRHCTMKSACNSDLKTSLVFGVGFISILIANVFSGEPNEDVFERDFATAACGADIRIV